MKEEKNYYRSSIIESGSDTGYITVHTPNSKYTSANGSATESNYTFTNQEKALFPVQQDNAPRGYLYDDRVGSTDSANFGILRNYEFIYICLTNGKLKEQMILIIHITLLLI